MPAARKLALESGIDFAAIDPTGPDGVILLRDVEAAAAAPAARASTLAQRLAAKEGIGLAGIEGSGVRGRIMRADVQSAVAQAKRPALGKVIPMESMRQVIARRMSQSAFTAPHIYFFSDVQMDPLLNFRREIVAEFEKQFGLRPSINDLLIKAVALNILDFPLLNASVKDQEIHIAPEINVCLAVALEDGLIVPAIANADVGGLVDIVRQRQDLVARARSGKLTMEEIERGTFTISSLAQYDITYFTAILNPPQSGILSIGKTREELYLDSEGMVKKRKTATFGLSVDHRIIDGTLAADFLQNLKWKLERPTFTFLHL
jgi:pyruvate dehydrogenase E2 component (dihydrolipoamide acetyltransferase)